jgi:hypothetical protein
MKCDIQKHYPDLVPYVDLHFGISVDQGILDTVVDQLRDSDSPSLSQIIKYAETKSQSALSAYRYAAANIICNRHTQPQQGVESNRYNLLV